MHHASGTHRRLKPRFVGMAVVPIVVLTLLSGCIDSTEARFERHAIEWANALLHDDGARLAALTTDDHRDLVPGLRRMVESLDGDATARVQALDVEDAPDELQAVCVTFQGETQDIRGGLMFRHSDQRGWLAWEYRRDMVGCRDLPEAVRLGNRPVSRR